MSEKKPYSVLVVEPIDQRREAFKQMVLQLGGNLETHDLHSMREKAIEDYCASWTDIAKPDLLLPQLKSFFPIRNDVLLYLLNCYEASRRHIKYYNADLVIGHAPGPEEFAQAANFSLTAALDYGGESYWLLHTGAPELERIRIIGTHQTAIDEVLAGTLPPEEIFAVIAQKYNHRRA